MLLLASAGSTSRAEAKGGLQKIFVQTKSSALREDEGTSAMFIQSSNRVRGEDPEKKARTNSLSSTAHDGGSIP